MARRSTLFILVIALVLAPACSKKKEKKKGDTAAVSEDTSPEAEDKEEPAAPPATAVSFEARISGGREGTYQLDMKKGDMAVVYDQAGFGHISLVKADRSIQIDFNSKNDKRPPPGEIAMTSSNLKGWMGNVDLATDDGTAAYISRGGSLTVEFDGRTYNGTFDFEAAPDSGEGEAIQVTGSFSAREK